MTEPSPGAGSLVSRHALEEIVRAAVLGSYGVAGFSDDGIGRRIARTVGLRHRGLVVSLRPELMVDLRLVVAYGLPVAEVARQVDSAVRYEVRRAVGREPASVTIHVGGLRYETAVHRGSGSATEHPVGQDPAQRPDGGHLKESEVGSPADGVVDPAPDSGR